MKEHGAHPKEEVMSRVLAIRNTNPEEEKSLCEGLLSWAEASGDYDGLAFAHTYLGDYYVGQYDCRQASIHLDKGLHILRVGGLDRPHLLVRIDSLRAICYEMQADCPSAVECNLKANSLAHRIGDAAGEGLTFNNLGFLLKQHRCYEEARAYYESAYTLDKGQGDPIAVALVIGNLTELLVDMGRPQDARAYMDAFEAIAGDDVDSKAFRARIGCCYHAAVGEKDEALRWADWALAHEAYFSGNRFTAFEDYSMFCKSMLYIGEQSYSRRFLGLMEASCSESLNHLKTMEEKRMEYILRFEPEEERAQAYKEYYRKSSAYKKLANRAIVEAMRGKIDLNGALLQQKRLQTEREYLEVQVNMDELTKLYNRRYLNRLLLKYPDDASVSIAVIMLDVDYFKEYNDFYGHLEGDRVLQVVARCLKEPLLPGITPCRYGGDEFTCFCEGLTGPQIEYYIRAVRGELVSHALAHEKSPCGKTVTLSIGYAMEECDPYQLLQLADQALYQAKVSGRDTYKRKRADEG